MRRHHLVIIFVFVFVLALNVLAATTEHSPVAEQVIGIEHAVVAEHATTAEHGEVGGHGQEAEGHGAKKDEHWTLFNYVPMAWTYPIAVKVGGLMGVPAGDIDKHKYNAHSLQHVVIMFFVLVLIFLMSVTVGGKYKKMLATGDYTPQNGVTLTNFVEMIVKLALGMMKDVIGHDEKKYLPLVGSLTFVILISNLLGLVPGLYTASDNLNTTLGLALVVFFMYHYFGIRAHGIGKYLAHFLGPMDGVIKYIMAPLMVPIEVISHLARPMSLSLRLFGNIFGDHKVLAVFMGLTAVPLIYPLPFLALGLLVAVVQTLVFVLLTMVYIGLATAQDH
jgi:F-type H+-transporting ATPase subunit a